MFRKFEWRVPLVLWIQAVASGLLCACGTGQSPVATPSDAMLLEEFRSHRSELERLRQMMTEDMRQRGALSEADLSSVSPESRRSEYRNLLSIAPNLVVGVDYNGTTRFIFGRSEGMAIGPGWAKGIEFVPEGARMIGTRVATLDESAKLSEGVYLREIEPQWFIFYQRDE